MSGDKLTVATGGTLPREDFCDSCGSRMYYKIFCGACLEPASARDGEGEHLHHEERVESVFCGNSECARFLKQIPDGPQ